jgi:eukaryotic-like serine/threonine-protein kinase
LSDRREFQRLEELYHGLAELPPEQRDAQLAALRSEEPALYARLQRYFGGDGEAVERSLLHSTGAPAELGAGAQIGPYRLLRALGEGGMGVVYEAEQELPLRRRVAVKLVRRGLDTERVVARFEAERSTLARLAHPAVAQVFDAGSAPDGRPYLVMELVEGEPITSYCDHQRLSTAERVGLLRQVCEAVQHAHQKGVLHRDLKPANILVSTPAGEPRVKVIDFGIAKLMGSEGEASGLTRVGEVVGTPEYMSPEQTRSGGADVDTRSDVYSLGVVLYELLTGRLPIDRESLRSSSPVEIARVVAESPPTPPSEQLAARSAEVAEIAALRGTDPARLRRELRGDLGRIVMMALRKEPERRYASVEQLSADLGRYLAAEPVLARPDSLGYRTTMLFRRHTGAAVAGLVLAVGLVVATGFSTAMYLRADTARRESDVQRVKAERIAEFVTTMLGSVDPEVARGRDVSLLRQVLDDAAARIDDELTELTEVAAELLLTIGRAYWSIGLEEEAERRLRSSLALWREVQPPHPGERIEAEIALGVLLRDRDQHHEAETLLRGAAAAQRALESSDEPADAAALAAALTGLARLLEKTGELEEVEPLYLEALSLERAQPEPDVEALSTTLRGYGVYLLNQRRMDEAEGPLREAVEVRRAAGSGRARLVLPLMTLARWFRWSERFEEAAASMREAVDIARTELPADHPQRLEAISELANAHQQTGAFEEAEALYREALAAQGLVHGELHSTYGTTANNLASLLRRLGRDGEAAEMFERAEAAYRSSLGDDHFWVSIVLANRAVALQNLRRFAEAEALLAEAARIRIARKAQPWARAEVEVWLAVGRVEQGDFGPDIEAALTDGIAALVAEFGEGTERDDQPLVSLARLYEATGRPELASAIRERTAVAGASATP